MGVGKACGGSNKLRWNLSAQSLNVILFILLHHTFSLLFPVKFSKWIEAFSALSNTNCNCVLYSRVSICGYSGIWITSTHSSITIILQLTKSFTGFVHFPTRFPMGKCVIFIFVSQGYLPYLDYPQFYSFPAYDRTVPQMCSTLQEYTGSYASRCAYQQLYTKL